MNNDLHIKIKIDSDNKELLITKGELKKLGNTADSAGKQTGGIAKNIGKIGGAVGGIYAVERAVSAVVDAGIAYNASMEKSLQTLTIIEGSSQKAEASLEWVEKFAISTPYAFEEVKESFVKLRAYGIDPTSGSLKTLGDTSAAMGKPIMAAVEAMADAVVGENERLKEFGIRASKQGDEIKYSWTTASGEMKEAVADNNAAMIQSTLEAIFNEKYAGAMEAQAKTWEGATSNMDAAWNKLAGELSKPIFDSAKDGALSMTTLFTELTTSIHESRLEVTRLQDIGKTKNIDDLNYQLKTMKAELKDLQENGQGIMDAMFGSGGGEAARINTLTAGIKKAERQIKALNATKTAAEEESIKAAEAAKKAAERAAKQDAADKRAEDAHKQWVADAEAEGDRVLLIWKEQEAIRIKAEEERANVTASALSLITTESEKINAEYMEMYTVVQNIFTEEQLNVFFGVWSDKLDEISEKNSGLSDQLKSDLASYGVTSKDWTSGLDGAAKSLANIGNAMADLGEDSRKYQKLQESIAKSNATQAEKAEAYADLESKHTESQLYAYSNIAGAMGNIFEEGSAGAKAMLTVQTALSVAAGLTAIANAMAAGDGYTAVARGAAVAAALASYGLNMGGGGSAGASPQVSAYESRSTEIEDTSDLIIDRLDRQISLLEVISLQGTSSNVELQKSQETFLKDYKLSIDSLISSMDGYVYSIFGSLETEFYQFSTYVDPKSGGVIDKNLSTDGFRGIDFIDALLGRLAKLEANGVAPTNELYKTTYNQVYTAIGDVQEAITSYATTMTDVVGEMSDAADSFRDLYDRVTGTTKYADIELAKAMEDVDALRGSMSYTDYLEEQITAISQIEDSFDTSIRNLLLSTDPADLRAQQEALYSLQDATGAVFSGGVEDALNFLDSIKLVGESMVSTADTVMSSFDALKALDDLYLGQYSPLSMLQQTAYANNIAYTSASTGGSSALDDAYRALETAAASATRDEDIRIEFNNVARLLEDQTEDATRRDLLNELLSQGQTLNDVVDRLERIEQSA